MREQLGELLGEQVGDLVGERYRGAYGGSGTHFPLLVDCRQVTCDFRVEILSVSH